MSATRWRTCWSDRYDRAGHCLTFAVTAHSCSRLSQLRRNDVTESRHSTFDAVMSGYRWNLDTRGTGTCAASTGDVLRESSRALDRRPTRRHCASEKAGRRGSCVGSVPSRTGASRPGELAAYGYEGASVMGILTNSRDASAICSHRMAISTHDHIKLRRALLRVLSSMDE